jgi:predicted ferric reductase
VAKKGSPVQATEMRMAVYRVLLGASFLTFFALVLAIPSYFETTTLWYKTGADKLMLITGQHVGLAALVLLYLQIILSVQGSFLSQVFGAANLIRMHKLNALFIVTLAASHILLVLLPEGLANLPLGKKFWPEMVGGLLFLVIALTVAIAYLRSGLRLSYPVWRAIHKAAGFSILLLVTLHVLFVSESFEQPIPRFSLLTLFGLTVIWSVVVKIRVARQARKNPHRRLS